MKNRDQITFRRSSFSPGDQVRLLEETILEWQALGPAAIWKAIYDILDVWFMIRGIDPATQRVDRTHFEIHPVPWLKRDKEDAAVPLEE